jgi:two-component sensor histidine kinase
VHELLTNAVKYGALATAEGHLEVRWEMLGDADASPKLRVTWRESGVAMPDVPHSQKGGGYGRELIERALPYQLGSQTSYRLGADGVHCTIEVPICA